MAKPSHSLFIPAETPKREHDDRRYDQIAKTKEWTAAQLRKCGDLQKHKLPHGVKLIRIPPDILEDPFKNAPQKDDEHEYDELEKRFYERLMNVEATPSSKSRNDPNSARPPVSISQKTVKSTKTTKSVHKRSSDKSEKD